AAMGAERTLAIVPGAHVALKVVELPAKTDAQARAAAPFLLEDDVAEDIDQSHLALGPARAPRGGEDGGTARAVAIVSRTRLAAWRAPFDAAELRLTHMTPDYLAVAPERRNGALWDLGDRLVAAFVDDAGERSGFALEPELATTLIGPCAQRAGAETVELRSMRAGALMEAMGQDGPNLAIGAAGGAQAFLAEALTAFAAERPLNLLQGSFAPRRDWAKATRPWRAAAAFAGFALAASVFLFVGEAARNNAKAEAYRARAEALYRETFPEDKRVVNPRSQMRARLGAMRGDASDGFLRLSAGLAASVEAVDAVSLSAVRFDSARDELQIDLLFNTYEDVEAVKREADALGLSIEEGGQRQLGDRLSGDAVVRLK
ncbi:MAG: type II secretion system protein GspL, partial [Pseudomonadota bacterium]